MEDFKNIKILQQGISLLFDVYNASKKIPLEELYGLSGQLKHSAISIPSNIAEGSKRLLAV